MNKRQLVWADKWHNKIHCIKQDLYTLENYTYEVENVFFVVNKKRTFRHNEQIIRLNSPVSIKAIQNELKKELLRAETFFSVVEDKDFMNCRCSHKSGSSECIEKDCDICNCSYDFFDSDINKILHERAGYIKDIEY